MKDHFEVEFVGGPKDGAKITVVIPPTQDGAPEFIHVPAEMTPPVDNSDWPDHLALGTLVDVYRGPAGQDEREAADIAYTTGAPVKYRYTGQERSK